MNVGRDSKLVVDHLLVLLDFLKGYYGGQLVCAGWQDANNEIFPIAYAIVNVEDKYNWKWCLTLLHQYLGEKK